jgi:hypothetical protein
MSAAAQKWLAGRAAFPGMLACGMRVPSGEFVCHSLDDTFPAVKLERILGQLAAFRLEALDDKLAPRWSTWTFDQAQIRFVERADGWHLALVIRAGSEALPAMDPLSREFLSLDLNGQS